MTRAGKLAIYAVAATLAWQASAGVLAAWRLLSEFEQPNYSTGMGRKAVEGHGLGARLFALTASREARIEAVLGDQAPVVEELRRAVPRQACVLIWISPTERGFFDYWRLASLVRPRRCWPIVQSAKDAGTFVAPKNADPEMPTYCVDVGVGVPLGENERWGEMWHRGEYVIWHGRKAR